jgi:hypothetical protein
MIPTTAVSKK